MLKNSGGSRISILSHRSRGILIFGYIFILLLLGLWPFKFFQSNNARHESSSPLQLKSFSTVYTATPPEKVSEIKAFTIFINLSSGVIRSNGYARILSYSLDGGSWNFMVGQWKNNLVFKLKVDGRSNLIHFETDGIFKMEERTSLAITFDDSRLLAFQDGKKRNERKTGPLTFSTWDKSYPLVIGSEANGKFPWEGRIYSIAIFDRALTQEEIKEAQHGDGSTKPLVSYDFVSSAGRIVKDSGKGKPADLIIPAHFTPYKRTVLQMPRTEGSEFRLNLKDILINVAGFIPLGFLFAGYLKHKGFKSIAVVLLAVATGFCISLLIEVLQAFLPTRSSDMMDLITNTSGTMIGCLALIVYLARFARGHQIQERGSRFEGKS